MASTDHRAPRRLTSSSLSWEPMKTITCAKRAQSCAARDTANTATLVLSTLDLHYDYYNSLLFFYDGAKEPAEKAPCEISQRLSDVAEPVMRIQQGLEKMLRYYPCAAGLLTFNGATRGLEVKYPIDANGLRNVDAITHAANGCSLGRPIAKNGNSTSEEATDVGGVSATCEDETGAMNASYGVPFHVAHADLTLADLGDVSEEHPSLDLLCPKKPSQRLDKQGHPLPRFVMASQVTTFNCGGFTIGHVCNHAYADGYSSAMFLQNLCSVARGAGLVNSVLPTPGSARSRIIKPREPPSPTMALLRSKVFGACKHADLSDAMHLHDRAATRFRFSHDALKALRASVAANLTKPCSRNQALIALLWTAFARVQFQIHGLPGSHEIDLSFPMNARTLGLVPMDYMGNGCCRMTVPATLRELCESPLWHVVDKIGKTVESLDVAELLQSMVDYIELQRKDGLTTLFVGLGMPTLVGLPLYDTDCGWGPPVYVGRPSERRSYRCIILDDPAQQAWNVLVVFASDAEQACFEDVIANYISSR